jgi:hypothetical protein
MRAALFHIRGRGSILIRIMRKKPSTPVISEVDLSLPDVVKMVSELRERIERLEADAFGTGTYVLASPLVKRGKGRRPKLEPEEVLQRRDRLTNWMEQNWPFLSVALRAARNSQEAVEAMTVAKIRMPGVFQSWFYADPQKYEEALWQFLQSRRFNGNPRNLAGAMAGLPELSWKRSLDICSTHPSKDPIAIEAIWDFMRREFPNRWQELRETATPDQVRVILAKSQTQNLTYTRLKEHAKEHPEEVLVWFNAGRPTAR